MESNNKFYEITGIVEAVLDAQTFNSGFRKRDLILTNDIGDNAKFQKFVKFTFKKDHCDTLDTIRNGQRVKIVFAVDGRKWDGPKGTQYFNDLVGIKIEVLSQANDYTNAPEPASPNGTVEYDNVQDEMPF